VSAQAVAQRLIDSLRSALADRLRERSTSATVTRVAVACSGGLDSMCLADALVQVAQTKALGGRLTPMILTVDHRLHERSEEWARAVTTYWRQRGVEASHLLADQALIQGGQGVEDGARRARYQALTEASRDLNCELVLLAHHAQDQVETILMRLQGPTGARGLAGIPPQRGIFVRPWLAEERSTLEQYALDQTLPVFEDPSNADPRWLRNRVRGALPSLAPCFEPGWTRRVAQSAQHAREQLDGLRWFLASTLKSAVTANPQRVSFIWTEGLSAPPDAQRVALLLLWELAWRRLRDERLDGRRLHDHLNPLWALWSGDALSQHQLPQGLWAWGKRGTLIIDAQISELERSASDARHTCVVEAPHSVITWGAWELSVARATEGERAPDSIAISRAPLPWRLRAPHSGERLHPLGAPGSKPIRQLWARASIPPVERASLPVLVDANDAVIWAPYIRPADHLRGATGERWVLRWSLADPLKPVELTELERAPSPG